MLNEEMVWAGFDMLEAFMRDGFIKVGVPTSDASICADILITADKRGMDSHGISRFKPIYIDRIKSGVLNPITDIEIIKESPTTVVIDGHNGMGHVIAKHSMELAIKKAKIYGLGMSAVRNSSHYGIAGYYPIMAAEQGMIGITGTNARPSVAPTFGVENMLGTNPLVFSFPTDEEFPFVNDYATSICQRGRIEVYARENKKLPQGWVIDEEGNAITDPNLVLEKLAENTASLTPLGGIGEILGGYKGYGYAAAVEIMSAALQGGNFLKALSGHDKNGNKTNCGLGHFFIAINISYFIELDNFKHIAGEILRDLRNSKKAPGCSRIYTPGEKEYLIWLERKNKGAPLTKALLQELVRLKEELGLESYCF